MNQIEFIKKWAKHGDRIEDGDFKANIYADRFSPSSFTYVFRDDNHMAGWDSWALGSPLAPILQSPKIYRLNKEASFYGSRYYREEWELVADYADEVKKEQENNGKNTLYGIIAKELSSGSQPVGNMVYRLASEVEKRLKALEEKIK